MRAMPHLWPQTENSWASFLFRNLNTWSTRESWQARWTQKKTNRGSRFKSVVPINRLSLWMERLKSVAWVTCIYTTTMERDSRLTRQWMCITGWEWESGNGTGRYLEYNSCNAKARDKWIVSARVFDQAAPLAASPMAMSLQSRERISVVTSEPDKKDSSTSAHQPVFCFSCT